MTDRLIKKCLDCGHSHRELEVCPTCGCNGAIDSQSTLYCPRCLGPIRNMPDGVMCKCDLEERP